MNDHTPRRFRFSLRFLLVWVLLASAFMLAFMKLPGESVNDPNGPDETWIYKQVHGWPFAISQESGGYRKNPDNTTAWIPFTLQNHYPLGICANFFTALVLSLLSLLGLSWMKRRFSFLFVTVVLLMTGLLMALGFDWPVASEGCYLVMPGLGMHYPTDVRLFGWVFPNYASGTDKIFDRISSSGRLSHHEEFVVNYLCTGICMNLLLSLAASFLLCVTIRFIYLRLTRHSRPVKND